MRRPNISALVRAGCLATFVAVYLAGPATARSLDSAEKVSLAKTVEDFNLAMRDRNYERVLATVPPKVLASIATKAKQPVEDIRKAMGQLFKTIEQHAKIESFGMDLAKAEYKETPNGTPYALIPTHTVIDAKDSGRFEQKSHSLALMDEGQWYLLRVSELQQLIILKEVYPEFTSVEFPKGSMEVLKK